VPGGATRIRINATRQEGARYGLGKIGFLVSENIVKIRLSVIGFAKDTFRNRSRGVREDGIDGRVV